MFTDSRFSHKLRATTRTNRTKIGPHRFFGLVRWLKSVRLALGSSSLTEKRIEQQRRVWMHTNALESVTQPCRRSRNIGDVCRCPLCVEPTIITPVYDGQGVYMIYLFWACILLLSFFCAGILLSIMYAVCAAAWVIAVVAALNVGIVLCILWLFWFVITDCRRKHEKED